MNDTRLLNFGHITFLIIYKLFVNYAEYLTSLYVRWWYNFVNPGKNLVMLTNDIINKSNNINE